MREGWELYRLKDICLIRPPKREVKEEISDDQLVSFVPMSQLNEEKKDFQEEAPKPLNDVYKGYTYFKNGDVLLAKITPCFENGKMGIANNLTNGIGFGSSEYVVYRPRPKLIPEYLFYFFLLPNFKREGKKMMGGAVGHQRIPKEFYEDYEIPIPPLPEQKRIVSILDEAFEAIGQARANIEKNIQNAEELFQSKLNEVFSQRGEGWEEKELSELIDLISGQHINTKDYNTENKGIGYLTGPSDFGDLYPTVSKWTEYPKRKAQSGDILVTVKGSGVGKINMLDLDEVAISRQLMAIRAKKVDTRFLYSFMKIQYDRIQDLANGAAIPGISREDVLNLKISIPDNYTQKKLVDQINNLEECKINLVDNYRKKFVGLEEIKKSILQKAFTGELTANETVAA